MPSQKLVPLPDSRIIINVDNVAMIIPDDHIVGQWGLVSKNTTVVLKISSNDVDAILTAQTV